MLDTVDFKKSYGIPGSLRVFLGMKFFAYLQNSFALVLINVYFYRITHDLSVLIVFNIAFDLAHTFAYLGISKISKEFDRLLPLRFGVLCQLSYLTMILYLGSSVSDYVLLLGILGGVADGTYWQADNLLKMDLTTPDNRLRFTTMFGMIKSVVNTIIPPAAVFLIVSSGHADSITGAYVPVFVASMIGAGGVFVLSFLLPPDLARYSFRKYSFWPVAKTLWCDRNIRLACYSTLLSEVPDVLPMLLGVYLYLRSGSELAVGGYASLTVVLVLISNYLLGSYVRPQHYKSVLIAGGIAQCLVVLILLWDHDFGVVFLYGIISSALSITEAPGGVLRQNALTFYTQDPAEFARIRVEFLTLKEVFDCVGKNLGYGILLLVGFSGSAENIAVVALGCSLAALLGNVVASKIK